MRFSRSIYLDFIIRFVVGVGLGMVFALMVSEGSYLLMPNKKDVSRPPREVELVIPYGTAEQVAAGVDNRRLPADMTFVEGDLLIVKNEDSVTHQLGPVVVPASSSSVLEMKEASTFQYDCSFEPSRYLGITILPRLTADIRFQGVLEIGLPTGIMLALYSYLIPARKKPEQAAA